MLRKTSFRISERYSRLRRRMWRRFSLAGVCLGFALSTLYLNYGASRFGPGFLMYTESYLFVTTFACRESAGRPAEPVRDAWAYNPTDPFTAWSDYYGKRKLPPMLPAVWEQRGWIKVLLPMWPFPAAFLASGASWWFLARREKFRHVCRCGYELAGLTSDTCPECGRTMKQIADA